MKILLSAFVCEPALGSEEGVGWGTARSLAQQHRVHVLTRPQHRAALERELALRPCANLSFSYHDFSERVRRVVVTSALWQIYYHAWQNRIAGWARAAVEDFDPDVIHHITYGRYWTPSSLWKLGRPFVWGPLGGGDVCPAPFHSCLTPRERLQAKLRALAQALASLDPALRNTARHATVAVASTPATARRLQQLGCSRVQVLLQMAVSNNLTTLEDSPVAPRDEILFCSVGRLLGWKGHALTLRAFARAGIPGARLVLAGDGPARTRLGALAKQLRIDGSVTFSGAIPRAEALRWIQRSTALIHSSFHDQAPTVVFEAMAAARPVVALELGGPAQQVTNETGFLIPARTVEQAISAMAEALRRLAADRALGDELGAAGQARVREHFTWDRKADQFCQLYRDAIAACPLRTHAGSPAGACSGRLTAGTNSSVPFPNPVASE